MKNVKTFLLLLFVLLLSLSLFACGGGGDGEEEGGNPPEDTPASDLELITDEVANFRIVLGEKIPTEVRKAVDLSIIQEMKKRVYQSGMLMRLVM